MGWNSVHADRTSAYRLERVMHILNKWQNGNPLLMYRTIGDGNDYQTGGVPLAEVRWCCAMPSSGDDFDTRLEHLLQNFCRCGDAVVFGLEGTRVAVESYDDGIVIADVDPEFPGQRLILVPRLQNMLGE